MRLRPYGDDELDQGPRRLIIARATTISKRNHDGFYEAAAIACNELTNGDLEHDRPYVEAFERLLDEELEPLAPQTAS